MQYLFFLPFCPFWLEKKSKSICRRNIILGKVKNETLLVIFKHTVKSGDACLTSNGRNNPRGIKQYFALYFMTGGFKARAWQDLGNILLSNEKMINLEMHCV